MSDQFYIPIIQGTDRKKRKSINVSNYLVGEFSKNERVKTELIDTAEFDPEADGNDKENKIPEYSEITKTADAFFLVVSEYNHSFPGSLKTLLDTELSNYIHKPVGFAGVSSGPWGGVRAIESIVPSVREMGMAATFSDLMFPNVGEIFDEDGNMKEEQREKYDKRVEKSLDELLWMTEVLKYGRENVE